MFLQGLVVAYVVLALAVQTYFAELVAWTISTRPYGWYRNGVRYGAVLSLTYFLVFVVLSAVLPPDFVPPPTCDAYDVTCQLYQAVVRFRVFTEGVALAIPDLATELIKNFQ